MRILTHSLPLYHGSVRLYSIQCYLRRSLSYLERYLIDLQSLPDTVVITDDWRDEAKEIVARGGRIFPDSNNPYLPWTVEVTALRLLEEMYHKLDGVIRLSVILPLIFPSSFYPFIETLVEWFRMVEEYPSLQSLQADHLLIPEFFSVMRQPVQFFGSIEVALIYGRGENQIYRYYPNHKLRLIDLSDRATILELGETVFSSTRSYDESRLRFLTELSNLQEYRASVLESHLYRLYQQQLPIFEARQQRIEQLQADYEWELDRAGRDGLQDRVAVIRDGEQVVYWRSLLQGRNYNQVMKEEFARVSPSVYQCLLEQFHVDDLVSLQTAFLQAYPEEIATLDINTVAKVMTCDLASKLEELTDEATLEQAQWFASAVVAGDNFLGARAEVNFLELWFEKGSDYWNGARGFFRHHLGEHYDDYFTTSLATPHSDWVISQWDYYYGDSSSRFSTYLQDTMIVSTLTSSKEFQGLDGWWCRDPFEIMIFHPEEKGRLEKVTDVYATERCRYSGEETEDNFLEEYA